MLLHHRRHQARHHLRELMELNLEDSSPDKMGLDSKVSVGSSGRSGR